MSPGNDNDNDNDNKNDDSKNPSHGGGEVISLDDVRRRLEEQMAKAPPADPNAAPVADGAAPNNPVNNFLAPVMAAIAQQLQGMAGPDGVVRIDGGTSDQSREKTAAVLKGLGVGLGAALAEAFGKWADKINIKIETTNDKPGEAKDPTKPD